MSLQEYIVNHDFAHRVTDFFGTTLLHEAQP